MARYSCKASDLAAMCPLATPTNELIKSVLPKWNQERAKGEVSGKADEGSVLGINTASFEGREISS